VSRDIWARTRRNPLAFLGGIILLVTGIAVFVVDVPLEAYIAQSSVPVLVGGALILYGWSARAEVVQGFQRTVVTWIGLGLLSFFLVGFWFGLLARRFDTSLLLAIVASLSVGAMFGALVGIYAARLRQTNAELAAQTDRLEQFAGIVSHDLRNPLEVARGRLALARRECDSEHLDDVETAHARMDELIDNLLTLSRVGDAIEDPEPVELAALSENSWQHVETVDASLHTRTDQTIRADQRRTQQLLENLFRNAVEHGGESVTLTVGNLADGFYVADDGHGIPADQREQIFDTGYTTSEDGTGFGLNIVDEIAEAHGWSVRVTDSESGGARFEVTGVEIVD
jgi:signal transduction histidine kinase